jgi:hypothetical protein
MDYLCKSFHLMIICIRNRRRIWTIHPCWYICHCRTFHSVHIRPCRRKTVRRPSWKILLRKRTRKSQQRFHSDRSNKYADFQRIRPNLFNDNKHIFINVNAKLWYVLHTNTRMSRWRKGVSFLTLTLEGAIHVDANSMSAHSRLSALVVIWKQNQTNTNLNESNDICIWYIK